MANGEILSGAETAAIVERGRLADATTVGAVLLTYGELRWLQDVSRRVLAGAAGTYWADDPAGQSAVEKIMDLWGESHWVFDRAEMARRAAEGNTEGSPE